MGKSQRRWIRDAGTPTVKGKDDHMIIVRIDQVGGGKNGVSFEMSWWQFREFVKAVREQAAQTAKEIRSRAERIEEYIK